MTRVGTGYSLTKLVEINKIFEKKWIMTGKGSTSKEKKAMKEGRLGAFVSACLPPCLPALPALRCLPACLPACLRCLPALPALPALRSRD